MLAFHNNPLVKKKYLKRVQLHKKADEIIKGQYWEGGKGCAVGCTIHSSSHKSYETELGVPEVLARLEDRIFEGLPNDLAKEWPEQFLKAIKPGTDLSNVWPKFVVWLLSDEQDGVIKYAKTEERRQVIQSVADLYQLKSIGAEIDKQDFKDAAYAAYAYADAAYADAADAAYAAYAYADAAYADAADAAYAAYAAYAYAAYAYADAAYADAAYADAADAAYAAYAAYAYADAAYAAYAYADAAKQQAYINQSKKLIELLKEAALV